ncbi:stage III sporulation protein AE [Cohnella sp. CFH 77786]|uniref:stage III sporulation protein AE n=1 Tax=Cohnella sp. CFH 77786 TaxID=2662265 RepID=UPI001C60BEA4|nr:stage III sporulation protein AE [Cohnella sp. CFH 77786]MBW5446781.1 stage III sporulation protein AE [Cohnella sp. CFH 77786]
MRRISVNVLLILLLLTLAVPAAAAAAQVSETPGAPDSEPVQANPEGEAGSFVSELARKQSREMEMKEIEKYWEDLKSRYGGYFPEGKLPEIRQLMFPEGKPWSLGQAMSGLLRFFLHEVLYSGKLLVTIVLLAVFTMILETMQTAFERNAVSKVAYAIAYLVLLILAVNSFRTATSYAGEAIRNMVQFMLAMVPLLLTLLAGTGSVASVAVLHPLIVFMIHTVGTFIHLFVFPLLFFSAVLHLVSSISDRYKVTQLANLLRNVGVGVMGLMFTVFLGVLSIQGAGGAVADGVALQTAKFVTGNFVPVVGRMISDAADTVLSASLLVKNAVGLSGVIVLLFLCAFPAVKVMTLALIYHVSGAVLQPLGNSPIVACLQTIGKTLIYVFAALAAVGLMFFLAITIILTAGNAALMIR